MLIDISNYANQFTSRQILIVGHTDTKGPPDYNVRLSERRGMSMYAHLTGNETVWESMYNADNSPNRKWGNREGRHMLRFLRDDSDNVYFTGTADDEGYRSTETIKRFQRDNDLNDDGDAVCPPGYVPQAGGSAAPQGLGIAANRFLAPAAMSFGWGAASDTWHCPRRMRRQRRRIGVWRCSYFSTRRRRLIAIRIGRIGTKPVFKRN